MKTSKILICLLVALSLCLGAAGNAAAVAVEKEKVGVLFLHVGSDYEYNFDWIVQFMNNLFDYMVPGMYVGGTQEGGNCYTMVHYADEFEAAVCKVEEGTLIDAACNVYPAETTVHELNEFGKQGDGTFYTECHPYDDPAYDMFMMLSMGHSTVIPEGLPNAGTTLMGPVIKGGHLDGVADFYELAMFTGTMERYYLSPNMRDVHMLQALKLWYGNDLPKDYGDRYSFFGNDPQELINVKDMILGNAALTEKYDFVFRHGWESYMKNTDIYGNPLATPYPDSTETAIEELIAAGVTKIVFAQTYPNFSNLTQYGHEWYAEYDAYGNGVPGTGISQVPGKTFKECVETLNDGYARTEEEAGLSTTDWVISNAMTQDGVGPKTEADREAFYTYKPWDKHDTHPFPEVKHMVHEKSSGTVEVAFAPAYGKYSFFGQTVLDMINYTINKYSIPPTDKLKVILSHHGYYGAFKDAQECDVYYTRSENLYKSVKSIVEGGISRTGTFELAHAAGEFAEGEYSTSDPPSPEYPMGHVMCVGEQIDVAINGKYINSQGLSIDNGDNNFKWIIHIPYFFEEESADTIYEKRVPMGNMIGSADNDFHRDETDKDGSHYDADDLDAENFTVRVYDASGWPSNPKLNTETLGPTEYKGSATNPTTIITTGAFASIGNNDDLNGRAGVRTNLTKAMMCTVCEALNEHCAECEPETLIKLASFDAAAMNKTVKITWATASETDNAGFDLYRAEAAAGPYVKINSGLIAARGGATQGASYEYADSGLTNGKKYYYKLEDTDLKGTATMHGPVSAAPGLLGAIFMK